MAPVGVTRAFPSAKASPLTAGWGRIVSAPSEARSRCRDRRCSLFLCALSCLMSASGAWVRLRLRVAARGAVARVSDAPAHERRTARSGGRAVRPWEASRDPRSAPTRLSRAGPVAPHHQTVAGTLPAPSRAQAAPLSRRYAIRNIWRRWRASLEKRRALSVQARGVPAG